jgi:hypothetical protein
LAMNLNWWVLISVEIKWKEITKLFVLQIIISFNETTFEAYHLESYSNLTTIRSNRTHCSLRCSRWLMDLN